MAQPLSSPMILPGSASLILSAAQHMLRLGGRLDRLMAQKTAVQSQLVLGMPTVRIDNLPAQCALVVRTLEATKAADPDPFGGDRATLKAEAANPTATFDRLFAKHFPDEVAKTTFNPDAAYLAQLGQAFPTIKWDYLGVRIAAFALAAGPDKQQIGYTGRVALAVADTILEFGAEHTALFVRDVRIQGVVQSVLQRFARPEWDEFTSWDPLLQSALRVALNSALDAADQLAPANPWLDAVLDALVKARDVAPKPDDFLLGLVQGRGVQLLFSQGLLLASDRLEASQASAFKLVAADLLRAMAPHVLSAANPSLAQFFRDHWGDLVRAGFSALDRHGERLLYPAQPLLNGVLKSLVTQLARTPSHAFLTSDTLCRLTDAAIGVVAADPAQLPGLDAKPWLRDFIAAAAVSAQKLTAKNLLTRAAADALLADALEVLARHPALVVGARPATLTLASAVFDALAATPSLTRASARSLGETALRATFEALAQDPQLVSTKFEAVVGTIAVQLAGWVGSRRLTSEQAAALASATIAVLARNPRVYAGATEGVATAVLTAVQGVFPPSAPWAPRLLIATARATLLAVARAGAAPSAPKTAAQLQHLLTAVLDAGLKVAQAQLGQSIDLEDVPPILGRLVTQALRGQLTQLDPASALFVAAFASLVSPPA